MITFFRDLLDCPLSLGSVHSIVRQAVSIAHQVNAAQDLSRVRAGSHDELFQAGQSNCRSIRASASRSLSSARPKVWMSLAQPSGRSRGGARYAQAGSRRLRLRRDSYGERSEDTCPLIWHVPHVMSSIISYSRVPITFRAFYPPQDNNLLIVLASLPRLDRSCAQIHETRDDESSGIGACLDPATSADARALKSSWSGCVLIVRRKAGRCPKSTSFATMASAARRAIGRRSTDCAIRCGRLSWIGCCSPLPTGWRGTMFITWYCSKRWSGFGCEVEFLDHPMGRDPHDPLRLADPRRAG